MALVISLKKGQAFTVGTQQYRVTALDHNGITLSWGNRSMEVRDGGWRTPAHGIEFMLSNSPNTRGRTVRLMIRAPNLTVSRERS